MLKLKAGNVACTGLFKQIQVLFSTEIIKKNTGGVLRRKGVLICHQLWRMSVIDDQPKGEHLSDFHFS